MTRENKKHIIWSSEIDYNDWKDDLEDEYPDEDGYDDYDRLDIAERTNWEYLDDERMNLDITLSQPIIAIGDLGLWDKCVTGYKIINSGNIADCLSDGTCDYITWYVDERGDLRASGVHHDGSNDYLYRVWKDGTTETQRQNFLNKIYNQQPFTRDDITRLTRRLGDEIARVYGWKI